MRITNQMLNRNYLGRMNKNLTGLTKSNEKMASQRKFNKGAENIQDAGKTLRNRKILFNNEQYQVAIRDAQGRAAAAEDALRGINDKLIVVQEKLVQGLNGTLSREDRDKLATEVEKMQDEVFQIMNTNFSGSYVFNSAGNENGAPPFTKQNGTLYYNGNTTPVDSLSKDPVLGIIIDNDGDEVQYNVDNYVDIGYGYNLNADGTVDSNSAYKNTFSGLTCFGYGTTSDGVPKNVYSLLGNVVGNLRNNNLDGLDRDLAALPGAMDTILTAVTDIGARSVTLESTLGVLEKEYINLAEIENELEGVDLSEEVMYNKNQEMGWMVTLQLSSKILPQSLFDFLR